jgi:hypothetical protein
MYLASHPLTKFEIEHVSNVIDSVMTNIANHNSASLTQDNMLWVDLRLQQRIVQLKKLLRDNDLQLTITRVSTK